MKTAEIKKMTKYNLYNDGQYHSGVKLLAIEAGSELDDTTHTSSRCIGTVVADSAVEFSPSSSAFQSLQTQEYIDTGLEWPNNRAVVVR